METHIYTIRRHPRLKRRFAIFRFNSSDILNDQRGRGFKNFLKAEQWARKHYDSRGTKD